jgi:hypothetical protein
MGASYAALADSFRLRISTIHYIIKEVDEAIWKTMVPLHMPVPTTEMLLVMSNESYCKQNFPNCVGSIEGKLIWLKRPSNSGSMYYNYKHYYSIVLQGFADARYRLTAIDVGIYGKQLDGGCFIMVHCISFSAATVSICLMLSNYCYQVWNFHL